MEKFVTMVIDRILERSITREAIHNEESEIEYSYSIPNLNSIESKIKVEGSLSESESNWECKQEEDEDYESSLPEEEIDSKEKAD